MSISQKNKKLSFDILFFTTISLLIFFRETCWLIEGSFKGDEFAYYQQGITKSFLENLFFIYPGTGVMMFWSNITNAIISNFSYEIAKILAKYFTVFVYFFIILFIYYSKSTLLISKSSKIFSAFVILVSPPMTPEVWMSSAHLRGYFGVLTFFLLFLDFKNQKKILNNLSYFLIFFSGICSIYSTALTPVFFLKFYLKRSKENFISFFSSLLSFVIQSIIVLNYTISNITNTGRYHFELGFFYNYFYNIIIKTFFGSTLPKMIFVNTEIYLIKNFNFLVYFLFVILVIISIFYILKKKDKTIYLMFCSLILLSGLVFFGSVQPGFAGGRYGVTTGVIFLFIVFRLYSIEKNFLLKNILLILLSSSIIVGSIEYSYKSPLPDALKCNDYSINYNAFKGKYGPF